jgi:hypothetical protein
MGAYRQTVALVPEDDRARLITAIFLFTYLAAGIPSLIAGETTTHYGLRGIALVYCTVVGVFAALGTVSMLVGGAHLGRWSSRPRRYPPPPPGPCSCPPYDPGGSREPESTSALC